MTVPELIELLQQLPGDSDLRIVKARSRGKKDGYGQRDASYWRTGASTPWYWLAHRYISTYGGSPNGIRSLIYEGGSDRAKGEKR